MTSIVRDQADAARSGIAERASAEERDAFARWRQFVINGGTPEAVEPGDLLRDFTLPDSDGEEVSLSGLLLDGPASRLARRLGIACEPLSGGGDVRAQLTPLRAGNVPAKTADPGWTASQPEGRVRGGWRAGARSSCASR